MGGGALVCLLALSLTADAAPTYSECSNSPSNNPESLDKSNCASLCAFDPGGTVPDDTLYCDAEDFCGAETATIAYAVEWNGTYVAVARCYDDSDTSFATILDTACCVWDDPSDEILGVAMRGTDYPDRLGLVYPVAESSSPTAYLTPVGTVSGALVGWLYGADGADFMYGSTEATGQRDELRGSAGNDSIICQAGPCDAMGNGGDDFIKGSPNGVNIIEGGNDSDRILGGDLADTLYGGDGDDFIGGGDKSDLISGGAGDDLICADGFNCVNATCTMSCNTSADGGSNDDEVDGGAGDDTIRTRLGADKVCDADDGDDIDTNNGADTIYHPGSPTINCGLGTDTVSPGLFTINANCDNPDSTLTCPIDMSTWATP